MANTTMADRVLSAIETAGATGVIHETLEIALDAPTASVRRVTQQLRAQGKIRVSHFTARGESVFVSSSVPQL